MAKKKRGERWKKNKNLGGEKKKNDKVQTTHSVLLAGPSYPVGLTYLAKWFYPDLFKDLDQQEIFQEYLDSFQAVDFDVSKHGVFVYHPLEHPYGHLRTWQ